MHELLGESSISAEDSPGTNSIHAGCTSSRSVSSRVKSCAEPLQPVAKVACLATKAFISTLHQLRNDIPGLPFKLLQARLEKLERAVGAATGCSMHDQQPGPGDSSCKSALLEWEVFGSRAATTTGSEPVQQEQRQQQQRPQLRDQWLSAASHRRGPSGLLADDRMPGGMLPDCRFQGDSTSWFGQRRPVLEQVAFQLPPEALSGPALEAMIEWIAAERSAFECEKRHPEEVVLRQLCQQHLLWCEGQVLRALTVWHKQLAERQQESQQLQITQKGMQGQCSAGRREGAAAAVGSPGRTKGLGKGGGDLSGLLATLGTHVAELQANQQQCKAAVDAELQQHREAYIAWWEEKTLQLLQLALELDVWGDGNSLKAARSLPPGAKEGLRDVLHMILLGNVLWEDDLKGSATGALLLGFQLLVLGGCRPALFSLLSSSLGEFLMGAGAALGEEDVSAAATLRLRMAGGLEGMAGADAAGVRQFAVAVKQGAGVNGLWEGQEEHTSFLQLIQQARNDCAHLAFLAMASDLGAKVLAGRKLTAMDAESCNSGCALGALLQLGMGHSGYVLLRLCQASLESGSPEGGVAVLSRAAKEEVCRVYKQLNVEIQRVLQSFYRLMLQILPQLEQIQEQGLLRCPVQGDKAVMLQTAAAGAEGLGSALMPQAVAATSLTDEPADSNSSSSPVATKGPAAAASAAHVVLSDKEPSSAAATLAGSSSSTLPAAEVQAAPLSSSSSSFPFSPSSSSSPSVAAEVTVKIACVGVKEGPQNFHPTVALQVPAAAAETTSGTHPEADMTTVAESSGASKPLLFGGLAGAAAAAANERSTSRAGSSNSSNGGAPTDQECSLEGSAEHFNLSGNVGLAQHLSAHLLIHLALLLGYVPAAFGHNRRAVEAWGLAGRAASVLAAVGELRTAVMAGKGGMHVQMSLTVLGALSRLQGRVLAEVEDSWAHKLCSQVHAQAVQLESVHRMLGCKLQDELAAWQAEHQGHGGQRRPGELGELDHLIRLLHKSLNQITLELEEQSQLTSSMAEAAAALQTTGSSSSCGCSSCSNGCDHSSSTSGAWQIGASGCLQPVAVIKECCNSSAGGSKARRVALATGRVQVSDLKAVRARDKADPAPYGSNRTAAGAQKDEGSASEADGFERLLQNRASRRDRQGMLHTGDRQAKHASAELPMSAEYGALASSCIDQQAPTVSPAYNPSTAVGGAAGSSCAVASLVPSDAVGEAQLGNDTSSKRGSQQQRPRHSTFVPPTNPSQQLSNQKLGMQHKQQQNVAASAASSSASIAACIAEQPAQQKLQLQVAQQGNARGEAGVAGAETSRDAGDDTAAFATDKHVNISYNSCCCSCRRGSTSGEQRCCSCHEHSCCNGEPAAAGPSAGSFLERPLTSAKIRDTCALEAAAMLARGLLGVWDAVPGFAAAVKRVGEYDELSTAKCSAVLDIWSALSGSGAEAVKQGRSAKHKKVKEVDQRRRAAQEMEYEEAVVEFQRALELCNGEEWAARRRLAGLAASRGMILQAMQSAWGPEIAAFLSATGQGCKEDRLSNSNASSSSKRRRKGVAGDLLGSCSSEGRKDWEAPAMVGNDRQRVAGAWLDKELGLVVVEGPLQAAVPDILLQGLKTADVTELPEELLAALREEYKPMGAKRKEALHPLQAGQLRRLNAEVALAQQQRSACTFTALQLLLKAGLLEETWVVDEADSSSSWNSDANCGGTTFSTGDNSSSAGDSSSSSAADTSSRSAANSSSSSAADSSSSSATDSWVS